jgi:hypothetical protein
MIMKSDEKRSHRLNYLLRFYLSNQTESALYQKAKQMGISDITAKDYIRTVIIQARKIHFKQKELNSFSA